jgi:hypothetical protein
MRMSCGEQVTAPVFTSHTQRPRFTNVSISSSCAAPSGNALADPVPAAARAPLASAVRSARGDGDVRGGGLAARFRSA